jgi:hypothetical protein
MAGTSKLESFSGLIRHRSGQEIAVPSQGWNFFGLDGRVAGLIGGISD